MSGQRILVTGGAGMIGSALTARLLEQGHDVTLLLRPSSNRVRLQELEARVRIVEGDVREAASVEAAVRHADPQVVFHLASTAFNRPSSAQEHLDTIVLGTLHVLEALNDRPGVRIVATGSAAEYGSGSRLHESQPLRPGTMLGAAKASAAMMAAAYARMHGTRAIWLRLFTPYGPGEHPGRLVPHVVLHALAGQDVPLTAGEQERDFVYLDDVVEALVRAAAADVAPGSVFNVGSGAGVRVRDLVTQLLKLMDNPVRPIFGKRPTRPDEIMQMSADISAAARELGWQPRVPLDAGLRRSIAWVRANQDRLRAWNDDAQRPVAAVAA